MFSSVQILYGSKYSFIARHINPKFSIDFFFVIANDNKGTDLSILKDAPCIKKLSHFEYKM